MSLLECTIPEDIGPYQMLAEVICNPSSDFAEHENLVDFG